MSYRYKAVIGKDKIEIVIEPDDGEFRSHVGNIWVNGKDIGKSVNYDLFSGTHEIGDHKEYAVEFDRPDGYEGKGLYDHSGKWLGSSREEYAKGFFDKDYSDTGIGWVWVMQIVDATEPMTEAVIDKLLGV
jgi:hypothetical protein